MCGWMVFVIKFEFDVEWFGEDARDALIAYDGKCVWFDVSDDGGRVCVVWMLDVVGLGVDVVVCDVVDVVVVDEV